MNIANEKLLFTIDVVADFVLVYTVLCRGVACRMECRLLRAGD